MTGDGVDGLDGGAGWDIAAVGDHDADGRSAIPWQEPMGRFRFG
ncbi:hypothetical protein ACFQS7_10250 [Dankookia sp. GCM10030260]